MPLEAALVLGRYLLLGLLTLFLFQLYQGMVRDLRRSVRAAEQPAGPSEARLVELGGARRAFLLRGPVTLGRAADNTIVLDDTFASGHHARVEFAGGRCWVEDLRSTNGTYVRGQRLQGAAELAAGDELRIGECVLRFEP